MGNKLEIFDKNGNRLTTNEVLSMLPFVVDVEKVTRVEVIDEHGRSYSNWKEKNHIQISFQDNMRTLKIFIYN
jgi:hypothetical protein